MPTDNAESWRPAGADLVAFALGLAVAWVSGWTTTDLVWSLWLSSLVVGYAIIVWTPMHPVIELVSLALRDRDKTWQGLRSNSVGGLAVLAVFALAGGALYLAFFTVHFGGFHFISARFLMDSFPIEGVRDPSKPSLHGDLAIYKEVMRRYWYALPSAFLAQRATFMHRVGAVGQLRSVCRRVRPLLLSVAPAEAARKGSGRALSGGVRGVRAAVGAR